MAKRARQEATPSAFGTLLRHWRGVRRSSQLELGLASGVSARHIGFLELGRANPSRQMVLRLAEALEVPLRERNVLLQAAGFAPSFQRTDLDAPEIAEVRDAIEFILMQHMPNPAVLMDRHYNIRMQNPAFARAIPHFLLDRSLAGGEMNFVRLMLDERGLRRTLVNSADILARMARRLARQLIIDPGDEKTAELLELLRGYSGVDALGAGIPGSEGHLLLVPLHLKRDGLELRLFTAATALSSAMDITLSELRIESYFPADETSRRIFAANARGALSGS